MREDMGYNQCQHPDITTALIHGYLRRPQWPMCPVCGEECDTLFLSFTRDVVACDGCVTYPAEYVDTVDAWEAMEGYGQF